jgi:hypothetical protein
LDNLDALRAILGDYDRSTVLLKAIRAAATEAIEAQGTAGYNSALETLFDVVDDLRAVECYDLAEYNLEDEPVFEDTLPSNVILFPR